MDFTTFAEEFTAQMTKQFTDLEVRRSDVDKLQGQSYHGLVFKDPEGPVGVSLNLDSYYSRLCKGESMEEVLEAAYTDILHMELTPLSFDLDTLKDYDAMKKYLILQLVPVEGNEEMLTKVPHRLFADLAVVYRFLLPATENGEASILVTKENLRAFGVTEEQLSLDAAALCAKNHPMSIRHICDVLFGNGADPEEVGEDPEGMIWVVSNESGRYGASVTAYPGALEQIADRLDSGYYLAPSSVHEMLAIPDSAGVDAAGLDEMVRIVNDTEVLPEDRLTNHSYHYDRRLKLLESARAYEARKEREERKEAEHPCDVLYGAFPEG